jgi:hypothetical protein
MNLVKQGADPARIENLDRMFGLGSCTSAVSTVCVTGELNSLSGRNPQDVFKLPADVHENFLALFSGSALATSNIAITAIWNTLANGTGPYTDTVEALSNIDHDAHEFSVFLFLKSLADRRKHNVEPEFVDRNVLLILELVGPFSTVLILLILPFRPNTFLEKVVVGLEGQFGDGRNVVLDWAVST